MIDWENALPSLEMVIGKHFPTASLEEKRLWAEKIYDQADTGAELERLRLIDRPASDDRESLLKAVKHLNNASMAIEKIGLHGGKPLLHISKKLQNVMAETPNLLMTVAEAPKTLAASIRRLADEIKKCVPEVPEGASIMMALGEESLGTGRLGQPQKTSAEMAASEAYQAFEHLSGRRPTVVTDAINGEAKGPFLLFLGCVFESLKIKASPETWARYLCKENSQAPSD